MVGYIDLPDPCEFEGAWQEGDTHSGPLICEDHEPVFTGLLDSDGTPIMRHPVRIRFGFHREADKYHVPSLEGQDEEADGAVVGWTYAIG